MLCTLTCDGAQCAPVVLIIWKIKMLIFALVDIEIFNPFSLGYFHSPNWLRRTFQWKNFALYICTKECVLWAVFYNERRRMTQAIFKILLHLLLARGASKSVRKSQVLVPSRALMEASVPSPSFVRIGWRLHSLAWVLQQLWGKRSPKTSNGCCRGLFQSADQGS